MTQPGYQASNEPTWWWQVAKHIDAAQQALSNAMAHNVDDPRRIQALHDRLREGQALLFEIFHAKGLLPAAPNGSGGEPLAPNAPAVPDDMITEAELVEEAPAPTAVEVSSPVMQNGTASTDASTDAESQEATTKPATAVVIEPQSDESQDDAPKTEVSNNVSPRHDVEA